MLENIRLSFQGIWSHKMRSFLTMLGIIIGIASIISIVSTIKGTSEQIKENLIGAGNNTITVSLYDGDSAYDAEYSGSQSQAPILTTQQKEEIREMEQVENASFYYSRTYAESIYYGEAGLDGGQVYGIDENYLDTCGYQMKEGRAFVDKDYEEYRKVAILDESAGETLFKKASPVGKTIEIKGEPFVVVGVITQTETFVPTINTIDDYYTYFQQSTGKGYWQ